MNREIFDLDDAKITIGLKNIDILVSHHKQRISEHEAEIVQLYRERKELMLLKSSLEWDSPIYTLKDTIKPEDLVRYQRLVRLAGSLEPKELNCLIPK
jgi:hypothetical protein